MFENKIDAPGFFSMFPPMSPAEMTGFEKMAWVRFIPLVDKLTVPDDMPVRFFSSRSIKISHQQCLALPVSLINQLLEIIKIALEARFQAVHVSIHDVKPAKPRNFKVAHGDPPGGEIMGILVPGHPGRSAVTHRIAA